MDSFSLHGFVVRFFVLLILCNPLALDAKEDSRTSSKSNPQAASTRNSATKVSRTTNTSSTNTKSIEKPTARPAHRNSEKPTEQVGEKIPDPKSVDPIPVEPTPVPTEIPVPTATFIREIVSPTTIVSISAESVDPIFAAVQNQWNPSVQSPNVPLKTENTVLATINDTSIMESMGQMLISLAFVISLGLAFAWFVRKYFFKNHTLGGGHIVWLGSYALSQKSKVHLIRVGSQHFLIGEGNSTVSLISQVDLNQETLPHHDLAPESLASPSFSQPLADSPHYGTANFQTHLSRWQNSLENRNIRQEVNASLLFLKGLTQRLRRKGERNA